MTAPRYIKKIDVVNQIEILQEEMQEAMSVLGWSIHETKKSMEREMVRMEESLEDAQDAMDNLIESCKFDVLSQSMEDEEE
jgi:hypothetical protein